MLTLYWIGVVLMTVKMSYDTGAEPGTQKKDLALDASIAFLFGVLWPFVLVTYVPWECGRKATTRARAQLEASAKRQADWDELEREGRSEVDRMLAAPGHSEICPCARCALKVYSGGRGGPSSAG